MRYILMASVAILIHELMHGRTTRTEEMNILISNMLNSRAHGGSECRRGTHKRMPEREMPEREMLEQPKADREAPSDLIVSCQGWLPD
jgi:hypothetical protein